jgi:DNA primase
VGETHQAAQTILVEDWLSANKVGQITEALPLFGTEIHPAHLYYLSDKSDRPIVLWLDKDQEGRSFKKAARLELLTGRPVKIITTTKDPKALSLDEIKEVLK